MPSIPSSTSQDSAALAVLHVFFDSAVVQFHQASWCGVPVYGFPAFPLIHHSWHVQYLDCWSLHQLPMSFCSAQRWPCNNRLLISPQQALALILIWVESPTCWLTKNMAFLCRSSAVPAPIPGGEAAATSERKWRCLASCAWGAAVSSLKTEEWWQCQVTMAVMCYMMLLYPLVT